jgi:hypothetical protein
MANGPYGCDFDCGHPPGGRGGQNLVEFTAEDEAYYQKLIKGAMQVIDGELVFVGDGKRRSVTEVGVMVVAFQNELYGPYSNKGVMGKVARERGHNALEQAMFGHKMNGNAASATPFRTYKVEPTEDQD